MQFLLYIFLIITYVQANLYFFEYDFKSNNQNRMYLNINNSTLRETTILPNQQGNFFIKYNQEKINVYKKFLKNNYIIDSNLNYYKKDYDLFKSKNYYYNLNIKKDFTSFLDYNATQRHILEIYFNINFYMSKNSSFSIIINYNNKVIFNNIITKNYFSFYENFIGYSGYNYVTIKILNINKKFIINCVTCGNGFLFTNNFGLIINNLNKLDKIEHNIYNKKMNKYNNFFYERNFNT